MHTVVIFLAHGCSEAINLADIILAAAGVVAGRVVDALNTHTHTHTHTAHNMAHPNESRTMFTRQGQWGCTWAV
jgi:ABC-type nickel/cobalt efflux system permease component RcnA